MRVRAGCLRAAHATTAHGWALSSPDLHLRGLTPTRGPLPPAGRAHADATPPSTLGGRRLVWIVLGSACVVVCFPRFFSPYVAATPVWSAVAASLFNVGWATTQVGHLALAPDLGGGDSTQLLLSAIRQVATVLSSLASFVLVRVSLALLGPSASAEASARVFHQVSLQVVYAGAISTLLCVLLVGGWPPRTPGRAARAPKREARATKSSKQREASASAGAPAAAAQPAGPRAAPRRRRSTAELAVTAAAPLGQWLTKRVFWHVGLLYTCARLSINLTATYMPLLLLEVCKRSVADVASVPILLYLCQVRRAARLTRAPRPRAARPRARRCAGAPLRGGGARPVPSVRPCGCAGGWARRARCARPPPRWPRRA